MSAVKAGKRRHTLRKILIVSGILLLLFISAALIFLFPVMRVNEFQSLDHAKLSVQPPAPTAIYDDNNAEAVSFEMRSVPFGKIPQHTVNAFIASEDKRFFTHKGVDYKRLLGAAWRDIKSGKAKEGGSTISQQVVKNTHLNSDKTLRRKLEEIKLARELEAGYSKEKILEIYLNRIYFGSGSVGIEAASRNYFGKPAESLTLSESAMLAGIIPSPKNYSPHASMEKALERRDLVLKIMLDDKHITESEYAAALAEKIVIAQEKRAPYAVNNYMAAALSEAAELTGLSQKDFAEKSYKIYTYLDKAGQESLEKTIAEQELPANAYGNAPDVLGILIDNKSGGVCAYCGISRHNLRTIKRQPASAIKPILVYAPALESNTVSEGSVLADSPADFNGYKPQNYGDNYCGDITVRKAVETSSNIVAVKILEYEGIDYAKGKAASAGIEFAAGDDTLALALGGFTDGITPLSLCGSYSVFARGGSFIKPSFIKAVYGPAGNLIYKNDRRETRVFSGDTTYIMTDILKGAAKRGTARKLSPLPFEVAAKTGTSGAEDGKTNNDAYCISYTSRHTLGVWMGNSEGTAECAMVARLTGGGLPAAVSRAVYEGIYRDAPPPAFTKPSSVVSLGGRLYAARYAPKPDTAETPAAPLDLPPALNGRTKAGNVRKPEEAGKEKNAGHAEKYARLKNESEEKKQSFFERLFKKMRKIS